MKLTFLKSAIAYIKSLGWGKEDVKKILMFIIMLLIACFIIGKFFPDIGVRISQGNYDSIRVSGDIDAEVNIPYGVSID